MPQKPMPERDAPKEESKNVPQHKMPSRFAILTKKLLAVSKQELRSAEKAYELEKSKLK